MNNKDRLALKASAPKLPHDKQLTSAAELVGHTIAALILEPTGRFVGREHSIIVTETRCWMLLETDNEASIHVGDQNRYRDRPISDYLSAHDMQRAGLVDQAEYARLLTIEAEANRKQHLKQIDLLRSELAALEAETKK